MLRSLVTKILLSVSLLLGTAPAIAVGTALAPCTGRFVTPLALDFNWFLSIQVGPVISKTAYPEPVNFFMPAVGTCPSVFFGEPLPCLGVKFWWPRILAEAERVAGCSRTLGGMNILGNTAQLLNTVNDSDDVDSSYQRHVWPFNVMAILDFFRQLACRTTESPNFSVMTEIQVSIQSDEYSAFFTPDGALFSAIYGVLEVPQSVAALVWEPIPGSTMYMSSGSSTMPVSRSQTTSGDTKDLYNSSHSAINKQVHLMHREAILPQSIGPSAICISHYNPFPDWGQYRYQEVSPVLQRGRAAPPDGTLSKYMSTAVVSNAPSQEHTSFIVWQAIQCCVGFK